MLRKCKHIDKDYFHKHPVLINHISLHDKIKQAFAANDDIFFLKAPGRVNLIGEHTDYNMGPVLPCAINKEIVFCVRPDHTSQIKVINTDEKFPGMTFSIKQKIEPSVRGSWDNYIKAGIKGILDFIKLTDPQRLQDVKGYDIIVSSTLPQAAGVSSSSALVVAAALSFVLRNDLAISKQKIAEICARAEHFVGTSGGGMDQAASLLAKKNSFLYMEFNPLRIENIKAPEGFQLVLFNSLVQAEKSNQARLEYNRRVLECRIAVDLFRSFFRNYARGDYREIDYIGEIKPEKLNLKQQELDKLVDLFLDGLAPVFYARQLADMMELTEDDFQSRYLSILQDTHLRKEIQGGYKIKSRFKHVYYECRRVNKVVQCFHNNNLSEIGDLINQSHDSLARDYEVSTSEVDRLVRILREKGAQGARIMGAGFGGMVLAFTDPSHMDYLIEMAQKKYYSHKDVEVQSDLIFPCITADGAGLL